MAALIAEQKNAMRLVALTPAARREGLVSGMTASAARALVPGVAIEALEPAAEHEDRCALVRTFTALSDRVGAPWADELVLEVSCTTHLFGGEHGIVRRARELCANLGHECRIALAADPVCAAALARHRDGDTVVQPGQARALMAPLPLSALRASLYLQESLRAVGVEDIGQFAHLDAASVAGRFGAEGVHLHRIARGQNPRDTDVGWGDHLDGRPTAKARLAGAETTLQLHFALPGLLAQLCRRLGEQDQAAVRIQVILRLENRGDIQQQRMVLPVRVGRATRNPATLERLIRSRLEDVRLEAPVDEMLITVCESATDNGWQPGLTDRTEATEPLPDLLARLADHLGDDAVHGVELVDAWRPEEAWRPRSWPPQNPHPPLPFTALGAIPAGIHSDDPVQVQDAWEPSAQRPRPALLLPRPEPIQVRVRGPQLHQVHLSQRGWVSVVRSRGPERMSGEWWAIERTWKRDYWVVEADGRIAWVYRDLHTGRWHLHGWF